MHSSEKSSFYFCANFFLKINQLSLADQALLRRSRLEENDVLFSIAGAIGRTYLVRHEDLPANVNQGIGNCPLRPIQGTPEVWILLDE
jgi:hypothetical protein